MTKSAMADLLEGTEEQVRRDVDPQDVIKLVRRLRRVSFFLRIKGELVTERSEETYRCYDVSDNVQVPARQAIKILTRWAEFNERKVEQGKPTGTIEVCRLSACLFIG